MLLESVLHEKYMEYLKSRQISFEHEVGIYNGVIDFLVSFEGKTVGVEVKADRSNLFSALGQLMNAKRTFSDVYLLSTEEFYSEIFDILSELGLHDQFGFIIFKNKEFQTISKPKTKSYYYNEKYYKPPKTKKTKTLVLDNAVINFLERHKETPFFCSDIVREMNISMFLAQSWISRFKRFGLIEAIPHTGLPKPFRVIKIPKEEYVYLNQPS
jgi:hypothetical protein